MCGVPSPVRAVHQHSLTREGERLIPMVFALPAVVDPPSPGELRELICWGAPQGRMLCIFTRLFTQGRMLSKLFMGVPPRGECA